jgi:hypothetical protein
MHTGPSLADDPERQLTLRQADQARTDFAAIESDLQFIMDQLSRVPTRRYFCQTLLMATASIWALLGLIALLLLR